MRGNRFSIWLCSLLLCVCTGCEMHSEYSDSARTNFEALWKILDEHYCFFEYKEVDWDDIYKEYSLQIDEEMDEYSLFIVLREMLEELQDGHLNLISEFNVSRYEGWFLDYPHNFDEGILAETYFRGNYDWGTEEIQHTFLAGGEIGYIYYKTFKESVLESTLDRLLTSFENCKGLIIDVRNNTGGSITNSDRVASHFLDEKTLCAYIQHKTGKGRNDFSAPYPIYLHPTEGFRWLKPVVVITNRKCYSATNNFVSKMKVLPHVTILGDWTGGGSGFPHTSELPNGWTIRFSTSPILDINKQHTEFGIAPDIAAALHPEDIEKGKDTLIEAAIKYLQE